MNYTGMTREQYAKTWETPVGKDCISLETSLSRWLGERLTFMGEHTSGAPIGWEHEDWKAKLRDMGERLTVWSEHHDLPDAAAEVEAYLNAQEAIRWVANNLAQLWD